MQLYSRHITDTVATLAASSVCLLAPVQEPPGRASVRDEEGCRSRGGAGVELDAGVSITSLDAVAEVLIEAVECGLPR